MQTREQKVKMDRQKILERIHYTLTNGMRNFKSTIPQEWLKAKGLSQEVSGAGFSSGQIGHRKGKEYLDGLESVGFIRANNILSASGDTGYLVFAKYGITFPLKDEKGNVVNFYGIRIKKQNPEHFMMNEEGIYPGFPHEMTTRLYIVTGILDTATLLESKVLENRDAVVYIPEGRILKQHEQAIQRLTQLKSMVWIQSPKVPIKIGLNGRIMPKEHLLKMKANEGLNQPA